MTSHITKEFMDKIIKGDLPAIKREVEKIGIPVSYLVDDKLK